AMQERFRVLAELHERRESAHVGIEVRAPLPHARASEVQCVRDVAGHRRVVADREIDNGAMDTGAFEIVARRGLAETRDCPYLVVTRERLRQRIRDLPGRT